MREYPDLEHLKRQAKRLLHAFKAGDSAAVDEVNTHYNSAQAATFALHDAQLVVARSYGFDSRPKLKAHVDGVSIRLDRRDEILNSTPLGWACRWGRVRLVRLLIEHGADREEPDAEAWARPRSWALRMGRREIVEALG